MFKYRTKIDVSIYVVTKYPWKTLMTKVLWKIYVNTVLTILDSISKLVFNNNQMCTFMWLNYISTYLVLLFPVILIIKINKLIISLLKILHFSDTYI